MHEMLASTIGAPSLDRQIRSLIIRDRGAHRIFSEEVDERAVRNPSVHDDGTADALLHRAHRCLKLWDHSPHCNAARDEAAGLFDA